MNHEGQHNPYFHKHSTSTFADGGIRTHPIPKRQAMNDTLDDISREDRVRLGLTTHDRIVRDTRSPIVKIKAWWRTPTPKYWSAAAWVIAAVAGGYGYQMVGDMTTANLKIACLSRSIHEERIMAKELSERLRVLQAPVQKAAADSTARAIEKGQPSPAGAYEAEYVNYEVELNSVKGVADEYKRKYDDVVRQVLDLRAEMKLLKKENELLQHRTASQTEVIAKMEGAYFGK